VSALTDRYRNDRFSQCLELGQPAKLENEQETRDRTYRAMRHLYSICVSEEAKNSFRVSQERILEFLHHSLTLSFDPDERIVITSNGEGFAAAFL